MAVELVKSSLITNLDATPPVKNPSYIAEGVLREQVATREVDVAASIASIYRMVRVHSSERLSSLVLFCDAITSAAADIGLYDTAANGGAVVVGAVALFGSAVSIATAISLGTNITYEATPTNISAIGSRIWELLALAADPNKYYDVCLTLTAAATAAGTISLQMRSVRPSA